MAFSRQYLKGTDNKSVFTSANGADTSGNETDVVPYDTGKSANTNSDNTNTGKKNDNSTSTQAQSMTATTQPTTNQSIAIKPTAPTLASYTPEQYIQSQTVIDAANYLKSLASNKPGEFSSENETLMDDFWNQLVGREKFSYDLNSDMLYQQAKDQYAALGKMAMQDTMGQASALTGGYGNSYASTVGNQAYQGYMQELNNNIPEYYQMALNQYNQEGNDLYNLYSMARDQYLNDYSMYRDDVSDYYTDYANAYTDYMNLLNQDYNEYLNRENRNWDSYVNDQNLTYQKYRDEMNDYQWDKEFALRQAEHDLAIEAANNTVEAAGELSLAELNKLEELYSEADNEAIERLLETWCEHGKISAAEADRLMEVYYTDDYETNLNKEALNAPLLDGYMSSAAALATGNLNSLGSTTSSSRSGSSGRGGGISRGPSTESKTTSSRSGSSGRRESSEKQNSNNRTTLDEVEKRTRYKLG